jgi:SAP domain-containing new25
MIKITAGRAKRPGDRCKHNLRADITIEEFDAIYFYADELKRFARTLGISVGNSRKFEVEAMIREFLTTGQKPSRCPVGPRANLGERDVLAINARIINYVGDRRTKEFLLSIVAHMAPTLKPKSGQWYWLNDWRRLRQSERASFTYGDLADHLRSLMEQPGRLPQIPSARMNNFISDYLADPTNVGVSRTEIMDAWNELKLRPGPKTYHAYRLSKDDVA